MAHEPDSQRVCADCGQTIRPQTRPDLPGRPHKARGLCAVCYDRHARNGTLDQFPRRYYSGSELLEEYEWLHAEGYSRAQIAERLHITDDALATALRRARKAAA